MTPKERNEKIIKCAVYMRVSTDNQAEKDYSSLESQKEHILNFIKSRKFEDWGLFGIYEDAVFQVFLYNVLEICVICSQGQIWISVSESHIHTCCPSVIAPKCSVVKSYIFLLIVTNSVSIAPLTNFKILNPGVASSLLT